jgi:hypothetical protein
MRLRSKALDMSLLQNERARNILFLGYHVQLQVSTTTLLLSGVSE